MDPVGSATGGVIAEAFMGRRRFIWIAPVGVIALACLGPTAGKGSGTVAETASRPLGGNIIFAFEANPPGYEEAVIGGLKIDEGARVPGPTRFLTHDPNQGAPAISPTGDLIAVDYYTTSLVLNGPPGIATINRDGTGFRQLTDHHHDKDPSFSSDGSLIALARDGDIYVMGSDGSDMRPLTNGSARDTEPVFSPDGSRVVFTRSHSDRDGRVKSDLFSVPVAGGATKVLVDGKGQEGGATFSPDGRLLAYSDSKFLVLAHANGTHSRPLKLESGRDLAAPAFSPNGRYLACLSYNEGSTEERLSVIKLGANPILVGTIAHGVSSLEGNSTSIGAPAWGP